MTSRNQVKGVANGMKGFGVVTGKESSAPNFPQVETVGANAKDPNQRQGFRNNARKAYAKGGSVKTRTSFYDEDRSGMKCGGRMKYNKGGRICLK